MRSTNPKRSFALCLLSPVIGVASLFGVPAESMCQEVAPRRLSVQNDRTFQPLQNRNSIPSGYRETDIRHGQAEPNPVPNPVRTASIPQQGQTIHVPSRIPAADNVQQISHANSLPPAIAARTYVLRNCDWRQFEFNLLQMWMQEPQVQPLLNGEVMRVAIPVRDSNTANTMLIHRDESSLYFEGSDDKIEEWHSAMQLLDRVDTDNGINSACMISTVGVSEEQFRQVSYLIRTKQQEQLEQVQQEDNQIQRAIQLPPQANDGQDEESGGPVTVSVLEGLDILILTGEAKDVQELQDRINKFIRDSKEAAPFTVTIPLQNADPTLAAEIIQGIFDAQFAPNLGIANINPIPNPKGLLVTGKSTAIETIRAIVAQYDEQSTEPLPPAAAGFKKYTPRYISAVDAKQRIDEFFNQAANAGVAQPGNPEPVLTIADVRANILLVKTTPRYLQQVDLLMKEIDIVDDVSTNEIRIFKLKNTEAVTLQPILQFALNGNIPNTSSGFAPSVAGQAQIAPIATQVGPQANISQQGSRALQMLTVDRAGNDVRSGILFDVVITADATSNSLIVTGPTESMELIKALIERLDVLPDVETQIKVFQVINGDASALIEMLETLFTGGDGAGAAQNQGTTNLPLQSATVSEGQSLANLRFTLDERTNSIIASGPIGDLEVVRNLLIRLDEEDINRRQVTVYRLNNAFSADVADAVNEWLNERTALVSDNFNSPFVANQREVIVVPETVTNSLLVSAVPKYFDEVIEVIDHLDRRPPMVKVEVLIAEVSLNALEESGAQFGIQDSLLFGRGQSIADPLDSNLLTVGESLAGTAVANFGVGTTNSEVGFGGLVLSAGNQSVDLLLRALKDRSCLRVLSRPQLMTVENLQGRVAVVSQVPRVTGSTITNFGTQNNIADASVGVTLEVTPRVSPDGMIVMFVNAINSTLGASGVVVATDATGNPIESPIINETQAQTTVMARSGQTVVLSGLIQETKGETTRGVPILSNLPVIGPLFGFQSDTATRTELLIILKPFIVNDGDDSIRQQNNEEFDRMNWCVCDVAELYGSTNYDDSDSYEAPMTIYPDSDPAGLNPIQTEGYPVQPGFSQPAYPSEPGFGQPVYPNQPGFGQPVQQAPPIDFETSRYQAPQSNHGRRGLLHKIRQNANGQQGQARTSGSSSRP